jgi:AAA15 family ATPase/GTPase
MDFIHQTESHGPVPLNVREESGGTQRFFGLGGVLRELIENEGFLCIDELETSLHPELTTFFLQTFLMNITNGTQLLLTTHNQFLMDLDFMQDEMVWFCEKSTNGESTYYNLADFHLHKNIVRSNFYRAGKLGALPSIGSPLLGE